MKNFAPELIEQAKATQSPEELRKIAKENCIELTEEEAKTYFAQLHLTSGEMTDEELDNVSGGGCSTSSDGKKYTVVSSGMSCMNGQYLKGVTLLKNGNNSYTRTDHPALRVMWASFSSPGKCGHCHYLEFDGATGYCGNSGK